MMISTYVDLCKHGDLISIEIIINVRTCALRAFYVPLLNSNLYTTYCAW